MSLEVALAIRSHRCEEGASNPQRTHACALLEEFVAAGAVTSRPPREGLWRVGVAVAAGRLDRPEGALVVGLRARGEVEGAPGRTLALRTPSVSAEASAGAEQPSVVASTVHEGAERVRADLLGRTYSREGLSRVGARFADQLTSAIETAVDVDLPTDAYRFEDRGSDGWRLRGEQFPQCLLIRQRGDRLLGLWTSCGEAGGDYSGAYVVELHPAPVFL